MEFENNGSNYDAQSTEVPCATETTQEETAQPSSAGAGAPTDVKTENFRRLAQTRTNEIIRKLKTLSNLSNRNSYHYTEEQVKVIFDGIEQQVEKSRQRFLTENDDDDGFVKL